LVYRCASETRKLLLCLFGVLFLEALAFAAEAAGRDCRDGLIVIARRYLSENAAALTLGDFLLGEHFILEPVLDSIACLELLRFHIEAFTLGNLDILCHGQGFFLGGRRIRVLLL